MLKTSKHQDKGATKAKTSSGRKRYAKRQNACKSVDQLTAEQQKALRQMLVDGATFEDAEDAVNEMEEPQITARAVERYYRSDLGLQQDRIRHQIETARKLRQALADSNSDHGDLAEAVLITGLMGLNRGGRASGAQHAFRVRGQKENTDLKKEAFRLRLKRFALDRKILKARLETEVTKRELLTRKLDELRAAVEHEGSDRQLSPDILRQIQEIYGLASSDEPAPANHAEG